MRAIVLLVLALLSVPLFAVLALSAILSYRGAEIDLQAIVINLYQLTELPLLESLPLFAFTGYLLARSKAPSRLLRLSNALVGWAPGGLAIVSIWLCTLVTAITGASGVTIIALGGILLPALLENHYREKFSLGALTAGGSLGLLLPPSLPVILYGVISGVSIEDLFIAGIIPGLLIIGTLSAYCAFRGQRDRVPRTHFSWGELGTAFRAAIWEAPLPIVVPLGIYLGQFTVGEAAVVATTYVLFVEVVIYRDLRFRELGTIARDSLVVVGGILIILGMAMSVTNYLIDAEVPQSLFELLREHVTGRLEFLVGLNLFLLFVGCMIDIYAAIALVVPIIIPIAEAYGVEPVHLGIIFLVNLGIGYATPPVGLSILFIASLRFRQPILKLYWACLPFIFLLLLALALITYFPGLSLVLLGD